MSRCPLHTWSYCSCAKSENWFHWKMTWPTNEYLAGWISRSDSPAGCIDGCFSICPFSNCLSIAASPHSLNCHKLQPDLVRKTKMSGNLHSYVGLCSVAAQLLLLLLREQLAYPGCWKREMFWGWHLGTEIPGSHPQVSCLNSSIRSLRPRAYGGFIW